jgi:hypothetical protein
VKAAKIFSDQRMRNPARLHWILKS